MNKMSRIASLLLIAGSASGSTIFSVYDATNPATLSSSTAGQFGILVGAGTELDQSNDNFSSQGGANTLNIGFGSGGFLKASGPGTISGNLLYGGASAGAGSISNTTITGTTTYNQTLALNAISAATALSTYFDPTSVTGGHASTSAADFVSSLTGGNTLTVSGGGVHYYQISSNANLGSITINGGANDIVVINVIGNSQVHFQGSITPGGSLTADSILFNVGSSAMFAGSGANTATVAADIIAQGTSNDNPDSAVYAGRLFDIATNGKMALNSGLNVDSIANVIVTSTPEPASLPLLLAGAGLLSLIALRNRSRKSLS